MTSPEIKLIAVDLDGTLLREDHTTLSEANREALTRAAARGVEIVVATGRSISAVAPQVLELPFLRYFITCNGHTMYPIHMNEDYITRQLLSDQTQIPKEIRNTGYEQLSLFDTAFLGKNSAIS